MNDEKILAEKIANKRLDDPRHDPDSDESILARQFLRGIEPKTFPTINKMGEAIGREQSRWRISSGNLISGQVWTAARAPDPIALSRIPTPEQATEQSRLLRRDFVDEASAKLYVRCACIIAGLEAIGIKCEALP